MVKGLQIKQNVIRLVNKDTSIWRWALVGISTTLIDYFLFILIYLSITSVFIANFCAGIFSISFNYSSHYFWSFKSQTFHSISGIKYLVNLVIFWSINTLLLNYFIEIGTDPKMAKLIPICFLAPLSFLSLKFFVFRKRSLRVRFFQKKNK